MPQRGSRLAPGYRRTIAAGAVSAGFLLAGLAPASGAPGAPEQTPFANGQAKATALVMKGAPGVGSLELALGSGIAVSELKNQLAQAQAQSFDLGLVGTTLTAEGCDGEANIRPDQLPQPTRVDNRQGDAEAATDEGPVAGDTLGAGREVARATTAPSATAVASTVASTGPLLSVGGGEATAITEVLDGAARQARASVEVDLTIAGVLELSGLRWDAVHRTGKDPHASGTFGIGTAEMAGVPIPLGDLAQAEEALNAALLPTGLQVELPRVERLEEPTDLIRVTPLRLTFSDSEVGALVLGPLLNATREQREQLFDDLSAAYCDLAGVLLVADIGVSIAAGTGFLIAEIGGVEALSGEFVTENPFGAAIAPDLGAPPVAGPVSGAPSIAGGAVAPPPAPPAAAPAAESTRPVASIGPLQELCETIHPRRAPGCSEGAMAPLGALGLLATAAIGALDWRHQRARAAARATAVTR